MNKLTAFDSKEFKRSNAAGELKFYTPLGCGVTVTKKDEFSALYAKKLSGLVKTFDVERMCSCLSSAECFHKIGPAKAYRMSDELLKSIQHLIESVYISYVILPSEKVPHVEVGGYRCPKRPIETFDFLRNLSVYFSYITAWNYLGIESRKSEEIIIDGFHGKRTPAWDDLIARTSPIIFSHGDECNPFISVADIVAFLTDKKLWDNYLRLTPENIAEVWKGYSFKVDSHFIDGTIISKIKWYTDEHIELSSHYARPIVFLKADGYKTDDLKTLDIYPEATILAQKLNGCVQGFDKKLDSPMVRDGDVFIYAGEESKKIALTLKDMYKIKVPAFKELKEKIQTP